MSEMKFSDFQRDKRFKKLERTLKLINAGKAYRKESEDNEAWTDATSPSVSSINPDPFDSSAAGPSLHTSRIGSEVVASSNNLRNILLKKHNYMNLKTMATSSIKQYRRSGSESDDRQIMPPPSFNKIPRTSKSMTKTSGHDVPKLTPMTETDIHAASDIDPDSERDISYSLESVPNNFYKRSSRIFSNWRVLLNAQLQLIIKGTLEDGRVARSKPVTRRLTSTSVESIYKHVYQLQGSIVDVRSELPDYVRGKFCNGFPDDWQNVHQIWRSFIQEGCAVTFRWPTPISDSDDDLRSDITDLTVLRTKNDNGKTMNSMSMEYLSNTLQTETPKQGARHKNLNVNDSFTQTDISGTDGNVLCESDEVPVNQDLCDKENFNQNNLNYAENPGRINKITDILKEDKLSIIINNLEDKNCPQEYINKIIQMYDCVNYFISHNSSMGEQSFGTGRTMEEQTYRVQEYTKDNSHGNSPDCYLAESIPLQSNTCFKNLTSDKGNFPGTRKSSNERLDESESETYAGIPKIPAERILRQRESLIRPYKHKSRKKTTHPDYEIQDDAKNRCVSHVPPVQTCIPSQTLEKRGFLYPDDTSVSITEDELEFSNARKASHSELQNNYNKRQSDITKTRPREKLDILPRAMHEMQVHHTQKNEKLPNKLYNNTHNSDAREKINDDTNSKRCDKNAMIKTSADRKLERDEHCEFRQMSEEHQSKGPKPTIISSVPVNTNFQLKVHANSFKGNTIESKSDGRFSEELSNKNSLQKSSLSKNTSFEKNINPTLTMSTNSSDHPITQPAEPNCDTPKQIVLDHSRNLKSHEHEHDSKPKLLNDWTPKVVCISKTNCEFGLIFEGNLLNDAGHVMHKKFVTDIVLRRISQRLIETKDHKTYQLHGDLKDPKHVVPKELQKQCRSGCPAQIEEFCNMWVSAKIGNLNDFSKSSDDLCNSSVDILNIPMSSKGRKILPPLSYWTGERIIVKGDQAVYSPGSSKEYPTTPSHESPSTPRKIKSATKHGKNTSGQSNTDESKVTSNKTEEKTTSTKRMTNNWKDSENQEPAAKYKRKTARQFLSSSDDSSGEEYSSVRKRQKLDINKKNSLPSIASPNKSSDQVVERRVNPPRRTKKLSESRETVNANLNTSPVGSASLKNPQHSPRKLRDRICTYYQGIPLGDDTLSDDQVSQV